MKVGEQKEKLMLELINQGKVSSAEMEDELKDEIQEAVKEMRSEDELMTLEEAG